MPHKILVVEDEPAIADNITYALQTEGFVVEWCTTAGEAREALARGAPDLVILDIGLPDQNGFDLCREIRKVSDVPIVFVTARAEEIDRIVGLEIGGDDYIVKPFSPRELTARARAILRRRAPQDSPDRAARGRAGSTLPPPQQREMETPRPRGGANHPIEIDDARRAIAYYGARLDLARYEFRLLELLARHPGRVYSRDDLMEQVWEDPGASLDRTVDTHIKNLRAKLRKIRPDIDPIQTHRGLGYSLREEWPP